MRRWRSLFLGASLASLAPPVASAAPPSDPLKRQLSDQDYAMTCIRLVASEDEADIERGGDMAAEFINTEIERNPANPYIPPLLLTLGKAQYKLGQYADAQKTLNEAELIFLNVVDNPPLLAQAQQFYAGALNRLGEHELAAKKARASIQSFEKLDDISGIGQANYVLGEALFGLGQVRQAEAAYQRHVDALAKEHGTDSRDYAIAVGRLGMNLADQHDYYRAIPHLERSLELRRKLGDIARVGVMANRLASIHTRRGALDQAEPFREMAVESMEAGTGADSIEVIPTLTELVGLHIDRHDAPSALPHLERAEKLAARHAKPLDPVWLDVKLTRASYEVLARNPQAAVDIYEDVLARQNASSEVDPTEKRRPLSALASMYHNGARYGRARDIYLQLLEVYEQGQSRNSPDYAALLANLAIAETMLGDYDQARRHLNESLNVARPVVGDESELVEHIRWALGALELKQGNVRAALPHLRDSETAGEQRLQRVLAIGSEDRKRRYAAAIGREVDPLASLAMRTATDDPAAVELSLLGVVRRKGRVLDAVGENLGQLAANLDEDGRKNLDELAAVRSTLSELVVSASSSNPAKLREERTALEKREQALEEAIARQSSRFKSRSEPVTLASLRAALPTDGALIEIIRYRTYDWGAKTEYDRRGAAHYGAYVVTREGLAAVDLGPAAEIEGAVKALRGALADRLSRDVKQRARALDDKVMAPLRKHLDGVEHLVIAPDGELNLVPFAAFVDPAGRFLVERRLFTYVSTGRDLLAHAAATTARSAPFIFADPDFAAGTSGGPAADVSGQRSTDLSEAIFPRLPGTRSEAKAIGKAVPDATVVTGADATEARLKALHGPVILHAATHGFFLEDQPAMAADSRGLVLSGPGALGDVEITREDPLLRSGLVAAGADALRSGEEDGILTALEAASLDLTGTQLVVLSACETGLGDVQAGEGVYGLRRSLVLAGAQSQVMSMWKVDDDATRDLMVDFYRDLAKGEPQGASLRSAQLQLLGAKGTAHPYYWAAFVPSGDWRPVDMSWVPVGGSGGASRPVDDGEDDQDQGRRGRRRRGSRDPGWLRDYWREGPDDRYFNLGGAYTRPALPAHYQGTGVRSEGGFVIEAMVFAVPHLQLGADYQWDRWMAPDLATDDDIWINRLELRVQSDVVPFPADWPVRPALHPRLGLGLATGKWDATNGTGRDRDRFFGAGITPGADLALYIRLGDRALMAIRGGIAYPFYAMRSGGDRVPWDKNIGRSLVGMAGVSIGADRR